jgi:hypothetical protein
MKGAARSLTARVPHNRQHLLAITEAVVPNTPSTQRTPAPTRSPGAAPASPAALDPALHEERPCRSPAQESRASTLELDGLQDGEEQRVESWLHLSLGLETG